MHLRTSDPPACPTVVPGTTGFGAAELRLFPLFDLNCSLIVVVVGGLLWLSTPPERGVTPVVVPLLPAAPGAELVAPLPADAPPPPGDPPDPPDWAIAVVERVKPISRAETA